MNTLLFEPGTAFAQCHANCHLPLADGRILVVYFAGSHEKADDVGIWLSEYDGKIWQLPRLLCKLTDEPHWNPVIFDTKDGVRLVFKVGREIRDWRSYTMLSRDFGYSWSTPEPYTGNPAGGPVRSKPIRLRNGSLLAPNSDEPGVWRPRLDISYDEGASFERLADIPINNDQPDQPDYIAGRGAIQPTLWQDAEGAVHALLRTSGGYIFRSDSRDDGRSWVRAYNTGLPNNNSGIDVARADDGRLFLAMNPVSGDFAARTPLCVYVSDDNGASFSEFAVVDATPTDPDTGKPAELSYPSLTVRGDTLRVTYTWMRRSIAYWETRI